MASKSMDKLYKFDENGNLVEVLVPAQVGFIGWYAGPEPPEGYLYCDGSAIGRETYSELFEAVGTLYGAGDGAETFNLPDARGIFFRGDGGENNAAMGERQGDAIRPFSGSIGLATNRLFNVASGVFSGIEPPETGTTGFRAVSTEEPANPRYTRAELRVANVVPTAPENRPINLAMKPCIRYV